MFHTGVRQRLTARHFLVGDFGNETVPHSHPYDVEWVLAVRSLDENGFGVDIALMERVLAEVLSSVDNVLLNDLPDFSDRQPSLENLAVFLEGRLRAAMGIEDRRIVNSSVQIWESDTAWATFSVEL